MKKVGLPPARAVSIVANPLLVALPLLLVVSLATGDLFHALLWWGITVVGVSVIPLLFICRSDCT
ncbi:MAG: hypothetical protein J2P36_39670, partial [Ktedonobacteraceae bacterium]|nr:hypothetical protein [Ktedonobacteraceae bacterium]